MDGDRVTGRSVAHIYWKKADKQQPLPGEETCVLKAQEPRQIDTEAIRGLRWANTGVVSPTTRSPWESEPHLGSGLLQSHSRTACLVALDSSKDITSVP